jgi:hypothetical protein
MTPEPTGETVEIRGRTAWGDIVIRRSAGAPSDAWRPAPADRLASENSRLPEIDAE